MMWAEYAAHIGEMRNGSNILVGKLEGKKQLGRLRHRLENDTEIGLKEIGHENVERNQWVRPRSCGNLL
jgi:hypothetical protein